MENVFEAAYSGRAAPASASVIAATPWEIGRAQPAVVETHAAGGLAGWVLDVGCGTGENALHLAGAGLKVTGVDVSVAAIDAARTKAERRVVPADFQVADVTATVGGPGYDSVLDCGLLHSLRVEARAPYLATLHAACTRGAVLQLFCFSDRSNLPFEGGPRRFSEAELRGTLAPGWNVTALRTDRLVAAFPSGEREVPCWHLTAVRV